MVSGHSTGTSVQGEDVRARLAAATANILALPGREVTEKPCVKHSENARTCDVSAYDVALRLLGVRARSCFEMRQRLSEKKFSTNEVNHVVDRLIAQHLLDDHEFASEWVRSRHSHNARGCLALRHELREKGVADDIIDEALNGIDDDTERERVKELVERKVSRLSEFDITDREQRERHRRRLLAMVVRRGYPHHIALDVIDQVLTAIACRQPLT